MQTLQISAIYVKLLLHEAVLVITGIGCMTFVTFVFVASFILGGGGGGVDFCMDILSLSYMPKYVHVHPGYIEKLVNVQGTLKLHVRFCDRSSRSQRPHNENWYAHYFLYSHSMATNTSMS